jgi:acetyl esterase/lipase
MQHKFLILPAAFCLLFLSASAQYCTNNARYTGAAFFDFAQITVGADIQYGIATDVNGDPDPLRMDLYYPNLAVDASPKRPFVLLAHGGGFSSGDKQEGDIRDLCVHLAMRGFVCASINYRLGHDFSEYGQYKARYRAIQDGHAALRFVVNNANAVRIDTGWVFVGGQSAGALLALGLVYADQSELDSISLLYSSVATSAELGNLLTSGNNLTTPYTIKGIFNNWGGVAENEVDADEMIPTIAFHGELDDLVPIDADESFDHYTLSGSRALHNGLIANNVCSELTVDVTGGHGIYRNASSIFRADRASCFFKSVFCGDCSDFYSTDSIPANCATLTGLPANEPNAGIQVYPNPFDSSFSLEGLEGPSDVTVHNTFGQVVFSNSMTDGPLQLDVPPGIYLLTVRHHRTDSAFTTRLVRQ